MTPGASNRQERLDVIARGGTWGGIRRK